MEAHVAFGKGVHEKSLGGWEKLGRGKCRVKVFKVDGKKKKAKPTKLDKTQRTAPSAEEYCFQNGFKAEISQEFLGSSECPFSSTGPPDVSRNGLVFFQISVYVTELQETVLRAI